jgi:hypothetical protein
VCNDKLGKIVPFADTKALFQALSSALVENWDKQYIVQYAKDNAWDTRVEILLEEFKKIVN